MTEEYAPPEEMATACIWQDIEMVTRARPEAFRPYAKDLRQAAMKLIEFVEKINARY